MVKKKENKIVGLTACILAMVLVCSVAEAQNITSGLVAHWKLDEISGTTAEDSVGSLDGTFVGDPGPTWVDGIIGGAADFDCDSETDVRHIECGSSAALALTGDRSIATWFKIDDWHVLWSGVVTKGAGDGSYNLIRSRYDSDPVIGGSNDGIAFQVKVTNTLPNPNHQKVVRGDTPVNDGEWHLAVGTFDCDVTGNGGDGLLSIYVDGELDHTYAVGGGLTVANTDPVWINGQFTYPERYPNCSIDDVRIYNRLLTAEDIAYMYSLVNHAPQVDTGTFTGALVDTATQLDPCVTDDGKPEPPSLTYTWLKLSGPDGSGEVIFNPSNSVEDPCATFDTVGVYELRLSVSDSELDACDVLTVHVRATDDPIAHWDFETGTGTNVVDRSANNNFGTFAGDPEPNWVDGWVGDYALDVADNSYVAITTDPAADPNLNDVCGMITVSAWVKVDNWISDFAGIVTKGTGGVSDGGWLLMRYSATDSLAFSTPGVGRAEGSVNVKDGNWHHVVGIHNGVTISLYVDGVLDASVEASGLVLPKIAEVWIGGCSEETLPFDGEIDDVRIYNYAISESTIAELLDMGQGVSPEVDAGPETATFYVQNGPDHQLDGTLTDNDPPTATLEWTKESGPGTVEFSNATIEDPTVTFSEVGEYVLRLTAYDSLGDDYDEITITVRDPVCQNVIADGLGMPADLSGPAGIPDCRVDIHDFAAFAGNWLRCNDPQDSECDFPYND